ncbi:hypothetical protein NC653_015106 [Populus alba x Populus x berolinensis]|uniref:UBC core domain-containing protein n=1 Tax=Populus alba x Populus x berolinensis TaxID=444605 RepID=A0AAD6W4L9_9ROSI|nr:hypothetical protein NC653_015106 [Populus alba x Populus x berolinensis]
MTSSSALSQQGFKARIACNRLQKRARRMATHILPFRLSSIKSLIWGDLKDILYDSWSPAMTVSSICISILSMLSSSTVKQRPADNDRYVKNCRSGRSPKETRWWFHDDKV